MTYAENGVQHVTITAVNSRCYVIKQEMRLAEIEAHLFN